MLLILENIINPSENPNPRLLVNFALNADTPQTFVLSSTEQTLTKIISVISMTEILEGTTSIKETR